MWIEPIYDRTQADVDLIKLDPTNDNNKGAYNYNDLNRIENDCEYLMNLLNDSGLFLNKISIEVKTDWNINDIPTITEINRIRNNIITLNNMTLTDFEEIEFANTMDYVKANILEKDLYVIKSIVNSSTRELRKCNTFYCGELGLGLYTEPRKFYKKEIYTNTIYCGEEFRL